MASNDPNGWASIAAAYQAAGWTEDANGNWTPPSSTTSSGGGGSAAGGAANGLIDTTNLSGAPANTQADPNQGSDSQQAQIAYAMQQYNSNPAVQQYFASNYPDLAWMMGNSELLPILVSATINGWGQGKIDAALYGTTWWKQNGQSARQFLQTQQTDPATAAQEVASNKALVMEQANSWGISLSDSQATSLATNASMFNWNSAQINQAVRAANSNNGATPNNSGGMAQIEQVVKSVAGDYLMPADSNAIRFWQNAAASNGSTDPTAAASQVQAAMSNYYGQIAAQRFPWMAQAIKAGMTPKDYLAPYTSQAAKTLAISPDQIDWSNPKWQGALLATDPKTGQQVPLNADQFNKKLMQDPQFGYQHTQGAIDQAYAVAQTLSTTFGKIK